jgi:quercetin dioxygenase-like cupin family protein
MLKHLAAGLVAVAAGALQPAAFAADDYVPTRTILQQYDVPGGKYTVIMAVTDIEANRLVARHTHPGVEISYVLQGGADFVIDGQGAHHVKAGESFRLEANVKHKVQNGPQETKILAVYTIPKGAPVATPAPE